MNWILATMDDACILFYLYKILNIFYFIALDLPLENKP